MNTKKNQRYLETEERLQTVFISLLQTKELERITVRELCDMAGIHRSSFYLHCVDVYDLMEKIEKNLSVQCGELFTTPEQNYSLGERFVRLFYFVRDHQDFYRYYLMRNHTITVLDGAIAGNAVSSLHEFAKKFGLKNETELAYHQEFFKAGLTALLREWLRRGCVESPEDIAKILNDEYSQKQSLFNSAP